MFVFRGETFLGTELFDSTRPVMIGRHHDTQLRLDGDTVSRYHCRLTATASQIFVEDLDSGNGTLVNTGRVRGRVNLQATDSVRVGPYTLRVKLLTAPGPRPYDPALSENTTKINAILAGEQSGLTSEVALESKDGLYEALYRDALRRTTGGERPNVPLAAPQARMEGDSTQMVGEELALAARLQPVSEMASGLDAQAEARLKDLDALIASLEDDAGPWAAENTAPHTEEVDASAAFAPSEQGVAIDTREFARDLASRLALGGEMLTEAPSAQIIPLHRDPTPSVALDDDDATEAEDHDPEVAAVLAAAAELDDENPETDLLENGIPPQLLPQVLAHSGPNPLVSERPRQVVDPAATLAPNARPPIPRVPTKGLNFPGAPTPPLAPNATRRVDLAPIAQAQTAPPAPRVATMSSRGQAPVPAPAPRVATVASKGQAPESAPARRAPTVSKHEEAPRVAAPRSASRRPIPADAHGVAPTAPAPAAAPARPKRRLEARLMTPTSLRVDVKPASLLRDDSALDDVWETSGLPATPPPALEQVSRARSNEAPARSAAVLQATVGPQKPPPLPKRSAAPSLIGVRPQSRIDGFTTRPVPPPPPRKSTAQHLAEGLQRLPKEPVPVHFDGVEVSARVDGKLVDIAVLRKGGEEYILGHRTPQGAVAPARCHLGLRLVRINPDDSVDLVFPKDVGGHLVRGNTTVTFTDLAEGRKYSCLRLETRDVATVILGGTQGVSYHVRFLHRPKSLFRALRGLK
ncbi:MAG: FHA domain-containing protein [Deltaproteobacteria bacterium]|nr:FHA domain-containing protein [Deltaproteobacteria bacterium]